MKRNIKKLTALFLAVLMVMSTVPMLVSADDTEPEGYWKSVTHVKFDDFEVLKKFEKDADGKRIDKEVKTIDGREYTLARAGGTTTWDVHSWTSIFALDADNGQWFSPKHANVIATKPAEVGNYATNVGYNWASYATPDPGVSWALTGIYGNDVKAGDKVRVTAYVNLNTTLMKWNASSKNYTTYADDAADKPSTINMKMTIGANTEVKTVTPGQWVELTKEFEVTAGDISNPTIKLTQGHDDLANGWIWGALKVEKFFEKKAVGDGGYVKAITLPIDSFTTLKTNNSETEQSETINVNGRDIELKITGGTNWRRNGNSLVYRVDETVTWIPFIVEASKTKPASVGDYGLLHYGAWVNNRSTSSDSGWTITNLYNSSDVDPGDRVKITAQVYAPKADMTYMYYRDSNFKYGTRTYEYDSEGNKVASGGTHDVKGNPKPTSGPMRIIAGGAEHFTTVEGDKWCELTAEFDITDANINNNTITIDSGAVSSTQDTFYAMKHLIGSVKVEISKSANGSYTLDNGKEWQNISTVSMDDFTANYTSGDNVNFTDVYSAQKEVDGRNIYLAALTIGKSSSRYASTLGNNGSGLNRWTQFSAFDDTKNVGKPAIAGEKLFTLDRRWDGYGWNKIGTPETSIMVGNIFDEADVEVGDTVRVTAWVWPNTVRTVGAETYENVNTSVSMWVSERANVNEAWTDIVNYAHYGVTQAKDGELVTEEVVSDMWNKVELVYTITEENKTTSSIQINSDNLAGTVTHFPYKLSLAGVTVEKAVEKADQTNKGTITGKVALGLDYEVEGGVKVLVAAYKDNMFLGCDIIDYDYAGEYDFEIRDTLVGDDVSGADKVVAYIWDMNEYQPQILPIQLVKAE